MRSLGVARSAEAALEHPYVQQFHNPDDEPVCGRTISIPINDNTKSGQGKLPVARGGCAAAATTLAEALFVRRAFFSAGTL